MLHKAKQQRPEGWGLTRVSALIDTWLLVSNPVGEPETIYDEFYRLRNALREIRDREWVENTLNPQWAAARAREALADLELPPPPDSGSR